MSKRICPKCGATWPKGNFCPKDGTELQDIEGPPASKSVPPDMAATRLDAPVIRADVPPKSKKSKPASSEAKTVLDSPAVPLTRPPSTRRGKAKMVAPSQRQLSARKKDEIAARTRSEVAAEMPDSKRGGTASDTPALKPSGRAGADKGFSETQWFMKGMEVDADLLEMVEQEEYDRDDTISETDRKGFTLRRDDE